jgi:hypothetical protein
VVSEVVFALVLAGKREFLVLARREERSVCCQHCKERREVLYVVYIGKWVAQREREREVMMMMMMMMRLWAGWILYRVVSAPGKVLITGAYLVLERPNAGLVLSTSARFYAIVKPIHSDVAPDSWSWVRPPSFHDFICQ